MAKLTSSTGKTNADVSPDGNSIIFQSTETGAQVFWPAKDWEDLKNFIDIKVTSKNKDATS
jgi:hypothetical protein